MRRHRRWTNEQLIEAVAKATSFRQVLSQLGLKEAGGNYVQIRKYVTEYKLDTGHFRSKAWNKGLKGFGKPRQPLYAILIRGSSFQSFKLKQRLFGVGLKPKKCEECGWAKMTPDGYLPLELDHINGDPTDHRLENLRILCPNCHSLKSTHRGRNRRTRKPG